MNIDGAPRLCIVSGVSGWFLERLESLAEGRGEGLSTHVSSIEGK